MPFLKQFTKGLEDAGHTSEVVDLYAIRFDPVFRTQDFASYVHESMPREILDEMNLKQHVLDLREVRSSASSPLSGCGTRIPRPSPSSSTTTGPKMSSPNGRR